MILSFKIKQIIDWLLDWVENDYEKNKEEDTFLYQMFNGVKNGKFDFYKQSKELFLRGDKSPRKIVTTFEYPKDRPSLPCIVVREASKKFVAEELGAVGNEYFLADPESSYGERESFIHLTDSNVNLMCFSDNTLESMMIGEVLYGLLYGAHNTFEVEFKSFSFGLSEIMVENQVFPVPLIIKNITMELKYGERFASIASGNIIKDVEFDSIAIK